MENETFAPDFVDADFVVIAEGDSMINARIFDGDMVYIRQQDTVEDGQIAAVLFDGLVHLGRIQNLNDGFYLRPENPAYKSQIFYHEEDNARIIGRAVAFTSMIPDLEANA